jgi:hypothetical protein
MADEQMLEVYRHDAHKMRGRSHDSGSNRIAGVTCNLDVPYGADRDGSRLSRPAGKPRQTVDGHDTHYRLSLLTGESRYDPDTFSLQRKEPALKRLLATDDAEAMHRAWLDSTVVSAFNESVYYPHTSLKYHTLLVAALVDCYRDGHSLDDLTLTVDQPTEIVPHRTVFRNDEFALRIAPTDAGASIPAEPHRSWAGTWSRLPTHPLDTADDKFDMTLDASLRRLRSWSTALQFIEDYQDWRPAR